MFGMRGMGAGAPQKTWNEMYFHQKLLHIVDTTSSWLGEKYHYWLPALAIGATVSIVIFGAENAPAELGEVVLPVVIPVSPQTTFGKAMPAMPQGQEGEEEEMEM